MRISDWSSDVCSSDLVDHGFVSALAGGVVVDLHLARRLAEKLEVDLVMRVAVEAGARVGEEAGDDAGRGDGLQACLEEAIAEEAARLVVAGGEAEPRCTRDGQGDVHAPAGAGDMAADTAGVVFAPTYGPADRKIDV